MRLRTHALRVEPAKNAMREAMVARGADPKMVRKAASLGQKGAPGSRMASWVISTTKKFMRNPIQMTRRARR